MSSGRTDYWKFRDAECADTAYVDARRPCTSFLGRLVRKWNAQSVMSSRDQSPPHEMLRHLTSRRAMASASAKMPRRYCFLGVIMSMTHWKFIDAECADTPMSAPGAIARRLWGDASVTHMPATSLRKHSPPDTTARHRTLRRAMASAAAKMPRRLCILSGGFLNERNFRGADMRCRQAAMQGASGATRPHMISSLRNHSPPDVMARHRTLRRAMASALARMPRRRVLAGVFKSGVFLRSVCALWGPVQIS